MISCRDQKKKQKTIINRYNGKQYIDLSDPQTIVISILDESEIKCLPISAMKKNVLIPSTRQIDISMIVADAYSMTLKQNRA